MSDTETILRGKQDWTKLENLKRHPIFSSMTSKQRIFLTKLLETEGDKVAAARAAYTCVSDAAAETHAIAVMRKNAVRTLLAMYYGYSIESLIMGREEYMQQLSNRLRSKDISPEVWLKLSDRLVELQAWQPRRTDKPVFGIRNMDSVEALVEKYEKEKKRNERNKASVERAIQIDNEEDSEGSEP